ncbi:MATE family efflux transporter [Flammeovirga aprica]|uniref:MATE family efflux transporter n=1 Tax=Flammeovirga aprica JL-4 TaxID=694437 RepID=A0A7X9RTL3_9BACT|nr:MATE family efflux transporter [Flammeovirga aprica]NME67382.1 MATE family efflux transporter [Flammeovirga aprica JL-4]
MKITRAVASIFPLYSNLFPHKEPLSSLLNKFNYFLHMADILKDKTSQVLLKMSFPISIGMLSTFLFQVIDTYFVGKLGGEALAALSFSSVLYFIIVGLFMGLAVGVSTLVGKAVGEQNDIAKEQYALIGLLMCFVLTVAVAGVVYYFSNPIFLLLGAPQEILPLIDQYMLPLLTGIAFLTTGIMAGSILRSTGNVVMPEVIMALAGVVNLFFDYALIFGEFGFPEYGIKGASYATVMSWFFMIIGMTILSLSDRILKFAYPVKTLPVVKIVQQITKVGLPTTVTQMIAPITQMYLTFILASHSAMAVGAFGVSSRIEMLMLIGILGVGTALTPFIAQNLGANQKKRIDEAIVFGGKTSTYLGIALAIILFVLIEPLASIFSEDASIIEYTVSYFRLVGVSYVFYGFFIMTSSAFNGLQMTKDSMKIMLIKSFAMTVPLTLIGSAVYGIDGIFIGLSLSNILGGIYASVFMKKKYKEMDSDLQHAEIWKDYKSDLQSISFWRG